MKSGRVKWFNNSQGFGFIEVETGGDIFVHYSVIQAQGYRSLQEGQQVAYECEPGPKGSHATMVLTDAGTAVGDTSPTATIQ